MSNAGAWLAGLWLSLGSLSAAGPENPDALAERSMQAHGLEAWWGVQAVSATVDITWGGSAMLQDARFYFEAHGPRARYEMGDQVVVFDGQTAWVAPSDKADPMTRFHVLTWPWFIMAPFKMNGDGIHLSDPRPVSLRGTTYHTLRQTFDLGEGDTPEDWYRLFIHPESLRLDAMSYIVTYGKPVEQANRQPSMILYSDYQDFSGVKIATTYEFWHWDRDHAELQGDQPKGAGRVTGIRLEPTVDKRRFSIPPGAVEVPLPGT